MTDNLKMTDNLYEFRKFVLKYLMEMSYKYIVRDKDEELYAYSNEPTKQSCGCWFDNAGRVINISLLSRIFTDIKWEDKKPFEIPCVNWDDVPEDTKVIVAGVDGSEWKCHFYKKVNDNSILVFRDGKTSWTTDDVVEVDINNVRFA